MAGLEIPEDWLPVTCPCGNEYHVQPSMAGGISTCPACKALVNVPAGAEPLWIAVLLVGGLGTAGLAALAGYFSGWVLALAVIVVGLLIAGAIFAIG